LSRHLPPFFVKNVDLFFSFAKRPIIFFPSIFESSPFPIRVRQPFFRQGVGNLVSLLVCRAIFFSPVMWLPVFLPLFPLAVRNLFYPFRQESERFSSSEETQRFLFFSPFIKVVSHSFFFLARVSKHSPPSFKALALPPSSFPTQGHVSFHERGPFSLATMETDRLSFIFFPWGGGLPVRRRFLPPFLVKLKLLFPFLRMGQWFCFSPLPSVSGTFSFKFLLSPFFFPFHRLLLILLFPLDIFFFFPFKVDERFFPPRGNRFFLQTPRFFSSTLFFLFSTSIWIRLPSSGRGSLMVTLLGGT